MGQALFVNSFPLSLAVRLNFLLLPAELGAGWKFPPSGPTGRPWGPEYPAQPNRLPPSLLRLHRSVHGNLSPWSSLLEMVCCLGEAVEVVSQLITYS